jgi:hypothetical protein
LRPSPGQEKVARNATDEGLTFAIRLSSGRVAVTISLREKNNLYTSIIPFFS